MNPFWLGFLLGGISTIVVYVLWLRVLRPWLSNEVTVVLTGAKNDVDRLLDALRSRL